MPELPPEPPSGDLSRLPPTPDQYQAMQDLVRELAPSGRSRWGYEDEDGASHTLEVVNYMGDAPHADESDESGTVAFVNHMDSRRRSISTLYYLEEVDPGAANLEDRLRLRIEEFDVSAVFTAGFGSLEKLEEAADKTSESLEDLSAAQEMGIDRASAAQAQEFIDLLGDARTKGQVLG